MLKHQKYAAHAPRHEKDESEVRWLISYSDFMMQLVCLFILLYSVSSIDQSKVSRIATAYRASIGLGEAPKREQSGEGTLLAVGDRSLVGGDLLGADMPKDLSLKIEEIPGGWKAGFNEELFDAGSSLLTGRGRLLLDQAAAFLSSYAGQAVVTGFAGDESEDSIRGSVSLLAVERAGAAFNHLTRSGFQKAMDARFLRAVGGATGAPAEGAAKRGRRVTLLLKVD